MNELHQNQIDQYWMKKALHLAKQACLQNEVPVGALIVDPLNNKLISKGYNLRETINSPLAHAEILAIHRASQKRKSWRLGGLTLYVSLEPCMMCCSVILQSRITRVVFGANDPKGGSISQPFFQKNIDWVGPVMSEESTALLKTFFKELRTRS